MKTFIGHFNNNALFSRNTFTNKSLRARKYRKNILSLKNLIYSSFFLYSTMNKVIGTHSGRFHTDEILATVMLKFLPEYKDAKIIRTRDQTKLDTCDIVVDVGGVYDHENKRYDHHQKEFEGTLDDKHTIRLSSAGLIYKHYGREVLRKGFSITDEEKINVLYEKLYTSFIESVDAVDNGINQYEGQPKYQINTTIQCRVNRFNPTFLEDDVDENERFMEAAKIVKQEFVHFVTYYSDVWYMAKSIVHESILNRFNFHKSGRVIYLQKYCPYSEHLYDLEQELNIQDEILYCIYSDRYNNFRCTAISKKNEPFVLRLPFPASFRGLKDEQLQTVSKIPGLTFVHYSGFTSAGENIESLVKLVEASLKENNIVY
ncbi:conserved protein, unknown function [Plasmodium gaboni]|uniref:Uncharacterized protein n=1 Tax=Plasmodium gaboni TaxID=647221 RepID=A0A151LS25_9APIC|nr:conserved protein, unknown function [Plasmodium gaboni]KYO01962.1 conserved protein, unknown function [Plasmodium gaboni]SOV21771.1 conserved protein, unknown function [Plasmodium sp. DRC-Itaito]